MKQLLKLLMGIPLLSFTFATVHDVSIVYFTFEPSSLEIQEGDSVRWTNHGSNPHTVTATDGSWSSGTISVGGTFLNQFTVAGSFDYACDFHSSMTGNITVSGLEVDHPAAISETFQLHPNYPNPFNPSTKITFSTEKLTDVSLNVFSVTGKIVKELDHGTYKPGTHSVFWNGRDEKNRSVSTGVYILTVNAGEQVLTRKMTLIK